MTAAQVTPEVAAREALAREALKRAHLSENLIEKQKDDAGALFEYAPALAKMRAEAPGDWARVKAWAKDAKVPLGDLERAMGAGDAEGGGRQGRPVEWNDPEPWPEPVDGAALLADIARIIQCHVSIDPALADTVALWIAVTWIHDRLEVSPFLNVTSATKRCGKSLLLEVLGELVRHPLPVGGRVTPSALFRTIEMHAPTMLLDEADTFFSEDDELRGVVNGSQRRNSAYILRCVGDDHEPRRFGTWCPKAIAGIGGLPDTVLDRSIIVKLARRPPNVSLTHWRDRDRAAITNLRRQIAKWCEDEAPSIVEARAAVGFPPGLHDRGRDAWETLLAIGNAAGDEWAGDGGRARAACEHVMASTANEETGAREMLLADLLTIFSKPKEEGGNPEEDLREPIGSKAVLDKLTAMEGRPWSEWKRGNPLSLRGLASLLKPFEVRPRNHRFPDLTQGKAYFAEDLKPHWEAYALLEAGGSYPSHPSQPMKSGTSPIPIRPKGSPGGMDGTDTNRRKVSEINVGTDGTDTNGGVWGEDAMEPSRAPPARPGPNPCRKAKDGE